ncbi:squalene/phytoene synthase family protein [Croceicoccus naphthovorans]|nr:squalene/phytoene synthase family protein [Croceicoccus naphthovorans]MBB3991136.1 phytoene synthase [Croceicoccus naphthovorans]
MSDTPDNRGFWEETLASFPPPMRLSLTFAPAASRSFWGGFFALDRRFAHIVATASEPMLAQMRLTWWREVLDKPADDRPSGEPLLAALAKWGGEARVLARLAEGWEMLVGEEPLDAASVAALAGARGDVAGAIARLAGKSDQAEDAVRAGYRWALADIASHLSDEGERAMALSLYRAAAEGSMPRIARPVRVLEQLAMRSMAGQAGGFGSYLAALRTGWLGR